MLCVFFFFNDTATSEIYTLSLHDALPICGVLLRPHLGRVPVGPGAHRVADGARARRTSGGRRGDRVPHRSEEHTSELQSRQYLVCRLLLEKKKVWRSFKTGRAHVLTPVTQ